jgi:4-hydroxy-tetrahydrodipicolinate synthase
VELARHAEAHGAAGVLCAAPFYYVAEPDGVLAYLERVDAVLERELVLYDNPGATKIHLGADTVVEWADRLGHLHTVKLTDHDLGKVATWQAAGLAVLGGDDPILLRFLAAGVDGVMVIAPVVLPEPFRRVWDLVRDGDLDAAGRLFGATIAPFVHAFGIGDEIATTKALLADVGVFSSDELRPPLTGSGPDRTALLRTAFEAGYAAFE